MCQDGINFFKLRHKINSDVAVGAISDAFLIPWIQIVHSSLFRLRNINVMAPDWLGGDTMRFASHNIQIKFSKLFRSKS